MEDWWQKTFPNGLSKLTIHDIHQQPVQIAYGEKGHGPTLVLMHGWGNWSYSYEGLLEQLSHDFRVICFDAKGYGYSGKPTRENPVGYQIEETIRVLEALGGKENPVVLVTESLSTIVGLAVAQRRPDLLSALVLQASAIFPRRMPHWSMHVMIHTPLWLLRGIDRLRLVKWIAPLTRKLTCYNASAIYHRVPDNMPERAFYSLQPYVIFPHALTYIFADSKTYAREIQQLLRDKPNLLSEIQADFAKVQCPCLVFWGQNDRWFPATDGEKLSQALPHAQLHIEPDCGHHVSGDAPQAVAQQIRQWLSQQ